MSDQEKLKALQQTCDHLAQRTAVLFLGAGVNVGTQDKKGKPFPLGDDLANEISQNLLGLEHPNLDLQDAAEMARFRLGDKALNDFLYSLFQGYQPSTAHLTLVQLPWDVIYTTNFDLLVEMGAANSTITPAGKIRPVFGRETELAQFTDQDILYYKLHGSVDFANVQEGRLILTKEDYRHYERFRKPLFRRLVTDLTHKAFVFLGYSLKDPNFRAILEDLRDELGTRGLPLSYLVRPSFERVEQTFWKDKFNIQLVQDDATDFLAALKKTWIAESRRVLTFEERQAKEFAEADGSTRFQKVGESFYSVDPSLCSGHSAPDLFFKGAELSWADAREHIAPPREGYWVLMEGLFADLSEPTTAPTVYLVSGHAGTGKSALIRTIAYDLVKEFQIDVLVHIPSTPLDVRAITPLVNEKHPKRIAIFVHHATEYVRELERFVDELKRLKLPVSLVLEARTNEWLFASTGTTRRLAPAEIDLAAVSENEIDAILRALEKYDCLDKLKGTDRVYQTEHFTEVAHKELLVALRELTTRSRFDEIIKDEYQKIPSKVAQRAYLYVAALGQVGLWLRYENLINLLEIKYEQLNTEIFRPTDGILISGEVVGSSRHNTGFRLGARHPVIASVIFSLAAPSDGDRVQILNDIISQLDPGYIEDRHLLEQVVRHRELVNTLSSPDSKRAIYDRLAQVLPGYPYVFQHRSILERELHNAEAAIRYAREAVAIERTNAALQNTLGMALEFAARDEADGIRRQAYLREAEKIFEDGMRRDPTNPFAYVGLAHIYEQKVKGEVDPERKTLLRAESLSMLEDAYEVTQNSGIIASTLGELKNELGAPDEALKIIAKALEKRKNDSRLRYLQIELLLGQGKREDALKVAQDGVKFAPTAWRIQRAVARIMRMLGAEPAAIRGHYDAAVRYNKGDLGLMVEFGAFLFVQGDFSAARAIFKETKESQSPIQDKRKIREWWMENGTRKVFTGEVRTVASAGAFVLATPENFEAFFWRTRTDLANLVKGDRVRFHIAFNAYGAHARIVEIL